MIKLPDPRGSHRGPVAAAVVAVATVVAASAVTAVTAAPAAAAGGSHNVTGKNGKVPRVLRGDQYECARTNPEMTVEVDSNHGAVRVRTYPGHLKFDIIASPDGLYWKDAYISAGNNPYGYNSAQCDWLKVGKGYHLPLPASKAGTLTASIKFHTARGFEGDAGFDIWLTGPGKYTGYGTTSKDEQDTVGSTEIMVWLNSPGIGRYGYPSLGYRHIDGRWWDVLYSKATVGGRKWTYVVFATSRATSRAVTVTAGKIHLSKLIRFAARKGWVRPGAELQAVDAGFEWYEDPNAGTQVEWYTLTGVR